MSLPKEPRENPNILSAKEIAKILPHRYPFALVDVIEDYEPGAWAIGRKCVTMNEPFFQGHFPGEPIMPGVLLLEALAQTGAVALLSMPQNRGRLFPGSLPEDSCMALLAPIAVRSLAPNTRSICASL